MCECLKREYKSELTRELSGLLRDGGETFADFRLDYCSAETDPALGASPRRQAYTETPPSASVCSSAEPSSDTVYSVSVRSVAPNSTPPMAGM